VLARLDLERQTAILPGAARIAEEGLVRYVSDDGKNCDISYSSGSGEDLGRAISSQIAIARDKRYELEWKWYAHDLPADLPERLKTAGFEAGELEAFMVLLANETWEPRFAASGGDIRRVTDRQGLADVRLISEEIYGKSYENRIEQWARSLENDPAGMSIHVAYIDGEPAASGRIYFPAEGGFAGLYGGQTRERFRKRGLFTQLVAVRIREALGRGFARISVDALPTSEPILAKLGFETATYTRPFIFQRT
jgi:GNAT superfamily N-acetyltransferase